MLSWSDKMYTISVTADHFNWICAARTHHNYAERFLPAKGRSHSLESRPGCRTERSGQSAWKSVPDPWHPAPHSAYWQRQTRRIRRRGPYVTTIFTVYKTLPYLEVQMDSEHPTGFISVKYLSRIMIWYGLNFSLI